MSQAPGLSGTPDSGHCSSAATRASCAASSARPTSRTILASPAISLADSILQIASTVRLVVALWLLALLGLGTQPLLLLTQLGRERLAEVLGLDELTQLDLAVAEGGSLQPLDRLLPGLHLPDPVPGADLLRLAERSVGDGRLLDAVTHACCVRRRAQPIAVEHHARLHELLVELAHLPELLLARHRAGLVLLAALHEDHEPHVALLCVARPFYRHVERAGPKSTRA